MKKRKEEERGWGLEEEGSEGRKRREIRETLGIGGQRRRWKEWEGKEEGKKVAVEGKGERGKE